MTTKGKDVDFVNATFVGITRLNLYFWGDNFLNRSIIANLRAYYGCICKVMWQAKEI